jgi:hypothetical protein
LIRVIPSHTHSACGLRQCGHSAFGSPGDASGAPADGCSVIGAVYARPVLVHKLPPKEPP